MKYIAHYNGKVQKWFPRSVNSGKTISTDRLMEEIANASTVAPADVAATLRALCDAMRGHLCDGDKVKLDNIGTFYLMADASGNGVASEDLVDSSQINRVNVRFAPQKKRVGGGGGSKNTIPVLASGEIRWERAKADDDSDGGDTPTPTPTPTPDPGGDEG